MLPMTRRNLKERRKHRLHLLVLILHLLLLQHRNPILQGNYVTGVRLHIARNILPCVKHRMHYVRLVVSRAITKGHANKQVISHLNKNLILQVEFTWPPFQQFQKGDWVSEPP